MMKNQQLQFIDKIMELSIQERIFLIETLWDSVIKDMKITKKELSNEQLTKIDRRFENLDNLEKYALFVK